MDQFTISKSNSTEFSRNNNNNLAGIKTNRVKATAALFESRSLSSSYSSTHQFIPSNPIHPFNLQELISNLDNHHRKTSDKHSSSNSNLIFLNNSNNSSTSQPNHSSTNNQLLQPSTSSSPPQSIYSDISKPLTLRPIGFSSSSSSLHHDLENLSLISDVETIQSSYEDDPEKQVVHLQTDLPSDTDSTSTSHHQTSISACSTSEHPSSQATSNSSHNLSLEQSPSNLKTNSNSLTLPQSQSSQPRTSQQILQDISTLSLNTRITEVALSIQEVALAIFQVQELRHSNTSTSSESYQFPSPQTSPTVLASDRAGGSALTLVDKALMRLEKKVQTTAQQFSELESLISPHLKQGTITNPQDSSLLNERFDTIVEEWERIQSDAQILKEELKEDKWLVVFRAVSSQAEEMMSSLEKVLTVSQEFIRDALKRTRHSRTSFNSHRQQIGNTHESSQSSTRSLSLDEIQDILKSHNTLSKNFHAKNKHYVPSCQRVLGILAKGITSRSTKNGEVLRRYADMNVRFTTIQEMIERTELDLITVDKLLHQHSLIIPSDPSSSTHCSIQVDDFSLLQPHSIQITPRTPSSSSDSITKKALSSMSNYIMSTSPKFFKSQTSGISNSISPFKKFTSKINGSTASLSSQPSSVSSAKTPPTFTTSTLNTQTSSHPQLPLRSIRSNLNVGITPSISRPSSRQVTSEEKPRPTSILFLDPQRIRPSSRQVIHNHPHPSSIDKPRWNISLKRVEDTCTSSASNKTNQSMRRASHQLSSSQSRLSSVRASTPSMIKGAIPARPVSVAGRSEASCMTTLSTNLYRSRPPSRNSRIPAPLWDRSMQAQRSKSKGSLELEELIRSDSGTFTSNPTKINSHYRPSTSMAIMRNGMFSPTSSDLEKMPTNRIFETSRSNRQNQTRRISRNSMEQNSWKTNEQLESLIETLELEEKLNPFDPLDKLIHLKCKEKSTKILARRVDQNSTNNRRQSNIEIAPGKGDLARYSFWFIGRGKPFAEKAVVCKLVESCSKRTNPISSNSKNPHHQNEDKVWKVLVRCRTGWKDLDSYLSDFENSVGLTINQ